MRVLKLTISTLIGVLLLSLPVQPQSRQGPDGAKGLTFDSSRANGRAVNVVLFRCGRNADGAARCNIETGDTACDRQLPLLCFKDLNSPAPAELEAFGVNWSGGIVAISAPVVGNQFDTVDDAHRYCLAKFGEGWRVADYHDGGAGPIAAYGNAGSDPVRVWIDIKTKPGATCWSR